MKVTGNIKRTVREDLCENIYKGSKLSIVAAFFTIYAYTETKRRKE